MVEENALKPLLIRITLLPIKMQFNQNNDRIYAFIVYRLLSEYINSHGLPSIFIVMRCTCICYFSMRERFHTYQNDQSSFTGIHITGNECENIKLRVNTLVNITRVSKHLGLLFNR